MEKENRIEEEIKTTVVYIDDHKPTIYLINAYFAGDKRMIAAECHSTKEALEVINKYNPNILFLDNSLDGGNEGLDVVDEIKKNENSREMLIISTTGNDGVTEEYEKRGIKERVDKTNFQKIKSIIDSYEEKRKNSENK